MEDNVDNLPVNDYVLIDVGQYVSLRLASIDPARQFIQIDVVPFIVNDVNVVVLSFAVVVRKMQLDPFAWGNLDGLGGVVVVGITSGISRGR